MNKYLIILFVFFASFNVRADMSICEGDLAAIQADRDHDGIHFIDQIGKSGRGWCNFSSDGILDKPIIIAEGFDFLATAGIGDNTTGLDIWNNLNRHGQASLLVNEGYDFIILDYNEPMAAIQANALLFSKLIETINNKKTGLFKNIVMGLSMGGLVAKSALSFMEYENIEHDASLYVSLDSPHGCAQVNVDLQNVLQFAAGQLDIPEAENMWEDVLRSNAAWQMLCITARDLNDDPLLDWFKHGRKNKVKDSYNTFLYKFSKSEDGYPIKTKNVAFANGSWNLTGLSKDDLIVDFNESIDILNILADGYDGMPGSSAPWFEMLESIIGDSAEPSIYHQEATFIPTLSALGIGPRGGDIYKGGRDESYWNLYEAALDTTSWPSAEVQELETEGMNQHEKNNYYRSKSTWAFNLFSPEAERPTSYQVIAVNAGVLPTYESCYDKTNEDNSVERVCYDSYDYSADLSSVTDLAKYTPFDSVYVNDGNQEHSDVSISHSEDLYREIKENTRFKIEVLIPAISLLIN